MSYCELVERDSWRDKLNNTNTYTWSLPRPAGMIQLNATCFVNSTYYLYVIMQLLTHISLASHVWDIGKQCTPRSDAASDQGLHCLLIGISIKIR